MSADAPPAITFRAATPEDRVFLLQVYASTRADELAVVPWTEEEKVAFLHMQFEAQDRDYRSKYPPEDFQLILADGRPIGRRYLHRSDAELNLIDIALLPEHRGQGIGTTLLRDLLAQATTAGLPVILYVEGENPARRLYRRFGFNDLEEYGPYWKMEWVPPASSSRPA